MTPGVTQQVTPQATPQATPEVTSVPARTPQEQALKGKPTTEPILTPTSDTAPQITPTTAPISEKITDVSPVIQTEATAIPITAQEPSMPQVQQAREGVAEQVPLMEGTAPTVELAKLSPEQQLSEEIASDGVKETPALVADAYTSETASNMGAAAVLESSYPSLWNRTPAKIKAALKKLPELNPTISAYYLSNAYSNFNEPVDYDNYAEYLAGVKEAEKLRAEYNDSANKAHTDNRKKLIKSLQAKAKANPKVADRVAFLQAVIDSLDGVVDFSLTFKANGLPRDIYGQFTLENNKIFAANPLAFAHEVGHWGFFTKLTAADRIKFVEYLGQRLAEGKTLNDFLYENTEETLSNSANDPAEVFASRFAENLYFKSEKNTLFKSLFNKLEKFFKESLYTSMKKTRIEDPYLDSFFDALVGKQTRLKDKVQGKMPQEKPLVSVSEKEVKKAETKLTATKKYPTITVSRAELEGTIPDMDKPQGLYVNREGSTTGVEPEMTSVTTYEFSPKVPLDLSGSELYVTHSRFGGIGRGPASVGVHALSKLLPKAEFDSLLKLRKSELLPKLKEDYPEVSWGRYYDSYEMLEGLAGIKAREAGYDSLIGDLEISVLDKNILKEVKKSPQKPLLSESQKEIKQAQDKVDKLKAKPVPMPKSTKKKVKDPETGLEKEITVPPSDKAVQKYNEYQGKLQLAERELEETNNRINNSKPKVAKITKMGNTNKLYKEFKKRGTGIVEVGGKRYYFDGKVSEGKCVVIPEELITAQTSAEDLMTQGKFELVSSDDIKQYWSNNEVLAQLYKEAKMDSKVVLEKVGHTLSSSNPNAVDLTSLGQFKNAFNSKKMIKPIYDLVPASSWDRFYLKNSGYIKDYAKSIGTSITPMNKNDVIQWAITANWNKFKSTPEGKRLQKDVMFALGMKERHQFYDYFKPLYDQEKMVLEVSQSLKNQSALYSKKSTFDFSTSSELGQKAARLLGYKPKLSFVERLEAIFNDINANTFIAHWIDYLDPIKQYDKLAYQMRTLANSSATNFGAFLNFGQPMYDPTLKWITVGKRDGGLFKIFNDIGEMPEEFFLHMLYKSAEELVQIRSRQYAVEILAKAKELNKTLSTAQLQSLVNKKVATFKKGLFGQDYNEMMQGIKDLVGDKYKLNKSKWDDCEKRLREYNKAFLDMAEGAGVVDPVIRASWERQTYIPFTRDVQDMVSGKAMKPSGKLGNIKKLEGSKETLAFDPMKSLIANYMWITDQTIKNISRKKAIPALLSSNAVSGPLTLEQSKATTNTIEVKVKGKSLFFKVHDVDLFIALTELNNDYLNNAFIQYSRQFKAVLTQGVSFSLKFRLSNFFRDTLAASIFEKNFIPLVDNIKGFKAIWNQDPRYAKLVAMGGTFGEGFYDVESKEGIARVAAVTKGTHFLKRGLSKKDVVLPWRGVTKISANLLEDWAKIGVAIENSTRVGLYIKNTEAGMDKLEAAYRSRDLLDFSRRGSNKTLGVAIAIIPFLNARVQGAYKTVKPETLQGEGFLRRSAFLVAASLLLFADNKDKDDYKALPDWDRFSNFHFYDGDTHYRIPLPFELGVLFNVLPTALAQSVKDQSFNAFFDALAFSSKQTFYVDPLSIQIAKPIIEASLNTNRFTGGAIESEALQKLPPEMRYDNSTSSMYIYASRFASAIGLNNLPGEPFTPKKMQALLEGYTAAYGVFAAALFDTVNNALNTPLKYLFGQDLIVEKPVKGYIRPQDYPGLSRFVMTGEMKYTKQQEEFYKYLREIEQVHSAVMYYRRKDPNNPEYEKYREKWGPIAAKYRVASSVKKRVGDINTEIQLTARNASLSAEERDARTQALLKQKNDLIKRTVEQLDIDM